MKKKKKYDVRRTWAGGAAGSLEEQVHLLFKAGAP